MNKKRESEREREEHQQEQPPEAGGVLSWTIVIGFPVGGDCSVGVEVAFTNGLAD